MKKQLIILAIISVTAINVNAQTWGEWFNQKKTQKRYLVQQIAGLQVYIEFAKKGYSIAKSGINTISDIKNGELNLHNLFFSNLKRINPKIKNSARVLEIVLLQLAIIKSSKANLRDCLQSGLINPDEMGYMSRVLENLANDCAMLLDELIDLCTNDRLELSDDQRIARIDSLYLQMENNYSFCKEFNRESLILVNARTKELQDMSVIKELTGLQ